MSAAVFPHSVHADLSSAGFFRSLGIYYGGTCSTSGYGDYTDPTQTQLYPNPKEQYLDVTGKDVYMPFTGTPISPWQLFHVHVFDTDTSDGTPFWDYTWASPFTVTYPPLPSYYRICTPDPSYYCGLAKGSPITDYTDNGPYPENAMMQDDLNGWRISWIPEIWTYESPVVLDPSVQALVNVHAVGLSMSPQGTTGPLPSYLAVSVNPSSALCVDLIPRGGLSKDWVINPPHWTCNTDRLAFVIGEGANAHLVDTADGWDAKILAITPSSGVGDAWIHVSADYHPWVGSPASILSTAEGSASPTAIGVVLSSDAYVVKTKPTGARVEPVRTPAGFTDNRSMLDVYLEGPPYVQATVSLSAAGGGTVTLDPSSFCLATGHWQPVTMFGTGESAALNDVVIEATTNLTGDQICGRTNLTVLWCRDPAFRGSDSPGKSWYGPALGLSIQNANLASAAMLSAMQILFTPSPNCVLPEVSWDIKRERKTHVWSNGVTMNPMDDSWTGDDANDNDERLTQTAADTLLKVFDQLALGNSGTQSGTRTLKASMREWMEVSIGGKWYVCSDYKPWHSIMHAKNDSSQNTLWHWIGVNEIVTGEIQGNSSSWGEN